MKGAAETWETCFFYRSAGFGIRSCECLSVSITSRYTETGHDKAAEIEPNFYSEFYQETMIIVSWFYKEEKWCPLLKLICSIR